MTRLMTLLAATSLLWLGAPHLAEARNPECRFGTETQRAVKRTIWCVALRLGVPGGPRKAVAIAERESGLGADELNPGGACGVFQHYPASAFYDRYEALMQRRWLTAPERCLNDRSNVIVSLTLVNRAGWSAWS